MTKPYKTYNFIDKDPVIDRIRTIIADEGISYTEVATRAGVAETTLFAWFYGLTRRPQHATVAAVCRAVGYDFDIKKRSPNVVKLFHRRVDR